VSKDLWNTGIYRIMAAKSAIGIGMYSNITPLKVQKSIFGDVIDKMQESTPKNQKHIQEYLSAMCSNYS
jgi:hypothetical protein